MQYDNETKGLIEQLDKQAKEIQAKIDELKNDNCKCVRWRAKKGEEYWTLDTCVAIPYKSEEKYCLMDNSHYKLGNYFKTAQEAEKHYKHLIITQKLKDIALRLNKNTTFPYFIYLGSQGKLSTAQQSTQMIGGIYCHNSKFLETAIKEIGEKELIKYIKGC